MPPPTGSRAWELAQRSRYELLVADVKMPKPDGPELLASARFDPDAVASHHRATRLDSRAGDQAGAYDFPAKPLHRGS
jgi:DNA-binding response OmpR family regulator